MASLGLRGEARILGGGEFLTQVLEGKTPHWNSFKKKSCLSGRVKAIAARCLGHLGKSSYTEGRRYIFSWGGIGIEKGRLPSGVQG